MPTPDPLVSLLDQLYGGVAAETSWDSALATLADAAQAAGTAITSLDLASDTIAMHQTHGMSLALLSQYGEMQHLDPARSATPQLTAGKLYIDYAFHGLPVLHANPFYQDLLYPHRLASYALVPIGEHHGRIYTLSVQRELGHGTFDRAIVQLLQALHPHVRHAMTLRQTLQWHQRSARIADQMLSSVNFPLLACDVHGRVVSANPAARTWLADPQCQLTAEPALASLGWLGLVERACGQYDQPRRSGAITLPDTTTVAVLPAPETDFVPWQDALAIVIALGRRWRQPPPTEVLQAVFRLSPAEARLALHLAVNDESLPVAANRLGVSHHTLRSQLQSIFTKTRTRRQSELVRLLDQLGLLRSGTLAGAAAG